MEMDQVRTLTEHRNTYDETFRCHEDGEDKKAKSESRLLHWKASHPHGGLVVPIQIITLPRESPVVKPSFDHTYRRRTLTPSNCRQIEWVNIHDGEHSPVKTKCNHRLEKDRKITFN